MFARRRTPLLVGLVAEKLSGGTKARRNECKTPLPEQGRSAFQELLCVGHRSRGKLCILAGGSFEWVVMGDETKSIADPTTSVHPTPAGINSFVVRLATSTGKEDMAHQTLRQPPQAPAPTADDDDKPAAVAGETGRETEETKPEVPPPRPTVDEDDSEDELDELDDLLDDFETPSLPPPPPPPPPKAVNTKNAGGKAPSAEAGTSPDDDFARQLQMGMADLLNEMGDSKELQDQFEHLVKELSDATNGPPPPASASASSSATVQIPQETVPKNFQDRIKQTMDRMHSSKAEVDSTLAENESEDFMAEMLKQLGASGEGGGEGDFSEMLLNVMEQLTSKEILYEPMKELNDKYPTWLEENKNKQTNEEMNRYKEQFRIVKEIVRKFEQAGYRDEDEGDREYIIERMQKMQAAGAPPPELMGEMGQGQGFPSDVDSNCGVQ